jgi:hypothetical protein
MNRYVIRLLAVAALIVSTPAVILWLGYSGHAAALGALLASALTWAPTLLALEGIARIRHPGTLPPARGSSDA